jgi:DNA-binding IclR family transcriptional regulator
VDYSARILAAVERTPLRSARAIFQETGGSKVTVFETVKRMIRDGRLVTDSEGVYQVGVRA